MKIARIAAAIAALQWLPALHAATWESDPAGSRLDFTATYEGQAAPGTFRNFHTRLDFDPHRPDSGRLAVEVDLASVDMHSGQVNDAIVRPEWLDTAADARAEFTGSRITREADDRYVAEGTLRIKGVSRAVRVPFTWRSSDDHGVLDGSVTLNRTEFGIGTGAWAAPQPIGAAVEVRYHVNLRKRP